MRLPISWTSSMADWPHVPAVSTATGTKICETDRAPYLAVLLCATRHRCPGLLHPMPLVCLVPTVAVWSHLVVCHPCNKLVGSFTAGMGSFNCPAEDVVHVMMTLVSGPLLRQDKPCRPRTSTAFPHKQECGSQALHPSL